MRLSLINYKINRYTFYKEKLNIIQIFNFIKKILFIVFTKQKKNIENVDNFQF